MRTGTEGRTILRELWATEDGQSLGCSFLLAPILDVSTHLLGCLTRIQCLHELVDLLFGHVFCCTVMLLDFSNKYLPSAVYHIEIVIGKFSPLLLDAASVLLPLACQFIPIHGAPPCCPTERDNAADRSSSINGMPSIGDNDRPRYEILQARYVRSEKKVEIGCQPLLSLNDLVANRVSYDFAHRVAIELAHDVGPVCFGRFHTEIERNGHFFAAFSLC